MQDPCREPHARRVRAVLTRHTSALLAIKTGTHCRWVSRIGYNLRDAQETLDLNGQVCEYTNYAEGG